MKRALPIVLLLVLSLLGRPQTAHAVGGTISGVIRDGQGVGLVGASVSLTDQQAPGVTATTQSDSAGHYAFGDLPTASFYVMAQAANRPELVRGHYPSSLSYATAVAAAEGRADIDIDLPVGGSISGHVTRFDDALPVEGLCVYGTGTVLHTDATGAFQDLGLSAGPYVLNVQDCRPTSSLVSVTGPRVDVALGQATTGYDLALHEGSWLHGRAVDELGGQVPSCLDALGPEPRPSPVLNGGDGTWRIGPLLPGAGYTLRFVDCSSSPALAPTAFETTAPAHAGETGELPDTVLHPPGSLSGSVVDQFGHPYADLCAYALRSGPGAPSYVVHGDAQGHYAVQGLTPGTWSVSFFPCTNTGFTPTYLGSTVLEQRHTVEVSSGQDTGGTDQTVRLWTPAGAPGLTSVTRSTSGAVLTVTPPTDDGGTSVTSYVLTTTFGTVDTLASFTGSASVYLRRLAATSTPTVTIRAMTFLGPGAALTVPVAALKATVTLTPTRATLHAGEAFDFGGRLTWSNGRGSPYVSMFRRAAGSGSAWRSVGDTPLRADGTWSYRFGITAPTEVRVMDLDRTGTVATGLVRVIGKVTATATRRTVTVTTVPARPSAVVQLQRHTVTGWVAVRSERLDVSGRKVETLPPGVYRYVLPAANYWTVVTGSAITLR